MTALSASSGHGAVAINYSDSSHSLLMQSSLGARRRYRFGQQHVQPCLSTDHR